jgi:alpha/beta superfamily hydrolase
MDNPIGSTVSFLANEQGLASLRFDFRGVGRSEGDFSNGEHEWDDVKHALDFLKNFPGVDKKRVGIVGYSFGASVVLHSLSKLKSAESFALIAPPLASVKDPAVKTDKRAKLFVVGRDDRVVPSVELQRVLDDLSYAVQFTEVPGADHRLNGHEQAVAERVVEFMLESL